MEDDTIYNNVVELKLKSEFVRLVLKSGETLFYNANNIKDIEYNSFCSKNRKRRGVVCFKDSSIQEFEVVNESGYDGFFYVGNYNNSQICWHVLFADRIDYIMIYA